MANSVWSILPVSGQFYDDWDGNKFYFKSNLREKALLAESISLPLTRKERFYSKVHHRTEWDKKAQRCQFRKSFSRKWVKIRLTKNTELAAIFYFFTCQTLRSLQDGWMDGWPQKHINNYTLHWIISLAMTNDQLFLCLYTTEITISGQATTSVPIWFGSSRQTFLFFANCTGKQLILSDLS